MNYRGVIRNFRNLNPDQFPKLKEDLELSMHDTVLAYCVSHYQKNELRDPYIDELRMLDRLSVFLNEDINSLVPTELFTNDDFVAQTYADLIEKRKAVNPNASYPCTLTEAARLASMYLFRSGKSNALRAASLIPENMTDNCFFPNRSCISAPESAYRLRVLPFHPSTPQKGDLLLLLTPRDHQPPLSFQKQTEELLDCNELLPYLKAVYTVRHGGLLRELLEITNHLWVDLSAFSPLRIPLPMTVLTDQYHGCRILRIAESALSDTLKMIKERNINVCTFAQITDDAKYTFSRGREETFTVNPQFMRLLFRYKEISVKLPDETRVPMSPIRHRAVTERASKYLSSADFINRDDAVTLNGVACAAASSSPRQALFKSAVYTALAPVFALSACGIDYSDQLLSIGMEFPKNHTDPTVAGECVSEILGLYRVQAELGLPAQAISLHTNAELTHPSITVFSVAEGEALRGSFSDSGHFVYCVCPQTETNGLPSFSSLRRLMTRLTQLGREKAICAMRVLCNESVTHGLQLMRHTYSYRLSDSEIASEGALPFAILLESDRKLEFRQVAITARCNPQPQSIPCELPKLSLAANRADMPEITLLSQKSDSDAQALASLLYARGATVRCFVGTAPEIPELARSILCSQVFILCKGQKLPQDDRVAFALDTLKRAGGCVISFNTTVDPSFIGLPNGISEEILMKICSK
ncbi:MAG: hypothetical protein IJX80_04285 [Clostridia bacterium]|nr:hypothetical protein [Clostridia bacterium]